MKNKHPGYINEIFSYFFKYLIFCMLIICHFFSQNKVFILLMVVLYKNLCKNLTLRGHIFVFVQIILQLSLTFTAILTEKNILNLTIFVRNIRGTFPKLILHLGISYQLHDVRSNDQMIIFS